MKLRRLSCLLLALLLISCVAYSALPYGYVSAAENDIVLNGEWLFNDTLTAPTSDQSNWDYNQSNTYFYEHDMNFYSKSSTNYFRMRLYVNGNNVELLYWYMYAGYETTTTAYYNSWKSNSYKTITFENCHVSEGFYYWLCANATCLNAPCLHFDTHCNNICDICGEVLPMLYWSTELEYMVTTGYGLISKNIFDNNPHYFCVIYNYEDDAPELITSRTAFTINSYRDVLFCENPSLYKLSVNDDGSFSHFLDNDVSSTSEGIYLDPFEHSPVRFLYSNVTIQLPMAEEIAYAYALEYDPFGGGETVGGGPDRVQTERFDIDIDTYGPVGGLPSDPVYGSGRVDVIVSPSAPPLSVPVSPTATPVPSDPVVTPSPDPSEPNSIIIQNQITNIGENIAALPEKLGDKIAGAIKGLFVPSEDDFLAIRFKWNMLLEERFGAVYESTAIIDSIVDTFQYSGDMSAIKFPSVTVDLAGTPFTFGGWDVEVIPEGFKFLVSSVKLIVSIVCTVLFVNAMRKKLEGLINR